MQIKATYYLDVISSWCFWAEPAWAELKKRFAGEVDFDWKIALMDKTGLPLSREQHEWFYRRSGVMMGSPFKLRSDWCTHEEAEFLAPNCVAKAALALGAPDDRVRLALAEAALLEGKRVGDWKTAVEIAARAGDVDAKKLLEHAQSPAMEKKVRAETTEFHQLQVTQRPTFVFENAIADRAIFSGVARVAPLAAALESMIADQRAYDSYAAHFGGPPA